MTEFVVQAVDNCSPPFSLFTLLFGCFPLGSAEPSAVDNVETSKPVLKMFFCRSFTDATNEQIK